MTFAVVLGSTIGKDVRVGPFVRMRPGTILEDRSMAGAFVDLKNATVGHGSKVPHLSYVGDADLGEDVNVGAGTVTVNFDGYEKHRTVIGDGPFVRMRPGTVLEDRSKAGAFVDLKNADGSARAPRSRTSPTWATRIWART